MSNLIDRTNKSAFQYSEKVSKKIIDICTPLKEWSRISCFVYVKVFRDSSYLLLMNGYNEYLRKYFEHITEQPRAFTPILKEHIDRTKGYFVWPNQVSNDSTFSLFYEHNIFHGFTMYSKTRNDAELFNFAFDRSFDAQNNFFLDNILALNEFSEHFKLVARDIIDCADKSKLAWYKHVIKEGFVLSKKENAQNNQEEFLRFLRTTSIDQKICFAKREVECIKLLYKGLTAKEIGRKLGLQHSTVKSYIENAKNKAGCNYKSQLINAYLNNTSN